MRWAEEDGMCGGGLVQLNWTPMSFLQLAKVEFATKTRKKWLLVVGSWLAVLHYSEAHDFE